MSEVSIPKQISDQKVEVTLADLAKMTAKQAITDSEPKVSRDDFLRLAKLRIQKAFAPKITAAQGRIKKLETAHKDSNFDQELTQKARRTAENDAKKLIGEVTSVLEEIIGANKKLKKLDASFAQDFKLGFNEIPETVVSLVRHTGEEIVYTVTFKDFAISNNQTCKPTAEYVKLYKKEAESKGKLKKAREDLAALEASQTKALGEIVDEVEMGLLETQISKSEQDQALAKEINERLDKRVGILLLPEKE